MIVSLFKIYSFDMVGSIAAVLAIYVIYHDMYQNIS